MIKKNNSVPNFFYEKPISWKPKKKIFLSTGNNKVFSSNEYIGICNKKSNSIREFYNKLFKIL